MSKTKSTPGPWRVEESETSVRWPVIESDTVEVAEISACTHALRQGHPNRTSNLKTMWRKLSTHDESKANAALISACPDLFDALAPIETEIENRKDGDIFHSSWNPDAHVELTLTIAECRAVVLALKKARGECTNA